MGVTDNCDNSFLLSLSRRLAINSLFFFSIFIEQVDQYVR